MGYRNQADFPRPGVKQSTNTVRLTGAVRSAGDTTEGSIMDAKTGANSKPPS